MATANATINPSVDTLPAQRAYRAIGLEAAEMLAANALVLLADPSVPIREVVRSLDAATDVYAEMAR